ncbi:MAG: Caspase domain-containing protein [Cyanobacteria bacterium J06638_20]
MARAFNGIRLFLGLASGLVMGLGVSAAAQELAERSEPVTSLCNRTNATNFLVMAGGGAPSYNEIALEKNVLYFQRTLQAMGYDPAEASVFFANGNSGEATIRYLDPQGQIRFKVPEIPNLLGASTFANLQSWIEQTLNSNGEEPNPLFFYFTGHGTRNDRNLNNNYMLLWGNQQVSVQDLAQTFDQLPADTPVVSMMAQCYSGSFANLIYTDGQRSQGLAAQDRCGFFATLRTLPSVGCTPEVNEADYRDYSSSFFAGLSGIDRTGTPVASADYNEDGRVAYAEAHAFSKVDGETTDLPVSTLEVWLQERATLALQEEILNQPMQAIVATARPEQRYVVEELVEELGLDLSQSFLANQQGLLSQRAMGPVPLTYLERIRLELLNIAMEARIRESGDQQAIATIDRLLNCESGSWQ